MKKLIKIILFSVVILCVSISVSAQAKKRKTTKKTTTPAAQTKPMPTPETAPVAPPKKNERPEDQSDSDAKTNKRTDAASGKVPANSIVPVYFYEFSQPDFSVSRVLIEHDESGKGKISFMKKGFGELISDPIQVSQAALERINTALAALNFLDSNENYQYEKDYSHLGNITIKIKKDAKERTAKFNWTQNKEARVLADEYRKIGHQFIWMFDIGVARENQPLESPKLMDAFDSLVRRKEISDSTQMIPFLQELSNDERIPLIARNHATRLIKEIEKDKK